MPTNFEALSAGADRDSSNSQALKYLMRILKNNIVLIIFPGISESNRTDDRILVVCS